MTASGPGLPVRAAAVQVLADDEVDWYLTQAVKERLPDQRLRILDAGCGRMWSWDLGGIEYHLTGIDEDAEALRLRVEERHDLDEAIVGDLRTVPLEDEAYDLVHSAFVLEHVDGAEIVLDRMVAALRPGGLMVIKIPDGHSVYGFLTRWTPHYLHVRYKRWIRRKPLAGTPGHGPYPVVYDHVISLQAIQAWASSRGMEPVRILGENSHLEFFGRMSGLVDAGLRAISVLSFGRFTARYSNLAVVFAKPGTP